MKPIEPIFTRKTKWSGGPAIEQWLLVASDVFALLLSLALTAAILYRPDPAQLTGNWWASLDSLRVQVYIMLAVVTIIVFWSKGHYSRRTPFSDEARSVLNISVKMAASDVALVFFADLDYSRTSLLLMWAFVPVLILLCRSCLKLVLIRFGRWNKPMVIIGWGDNAVETALAFSGEKLMGYTLTAFLVPFRYEMPRHSFVDHNGAPVPCLPFDNNPEPLLASLGRPHVVLAIEEGVESYQDIIGRLRRHGANLQIVPSIRGLPLYGMEVNHFFAHEVLLLTVRNNLARRFPQIIKRLFDLGVAMTMLIVGFPLLLWIALKVMASGRPVFYGHQRVGRHNKTFPCYKFRTMEVNADQLLADLLAKDPAARAEWEKDFKLKNDPRITPIGHFLRKTSLDELPQLWNVIRGEMSLVGPRPVVEAELERYGNQVEYYLEANPGITGLWQISGRSDITYDERVYLDAWYVKNWSLFSDIVILFKTVNVIFKRDGAY